MMAFVARPKCTANAYFSELRDPVAGESHNAEWVTATKAAQTRRG